MQINFISNQSLESISGGWSGNNYNFYTHLKGLSELNYIGPINPPVFWWEAFYSKFFKLLGLERKLYFLSNKRLQKISSTVNNQLKEADFNFFWGEMPWLSCNYNKPYGLYLDAGFTTYLDIYLKNEKFQEHDILRIKKLEEQWLNGAAHIFWGSNWAKNETCKNLNIENNNQHVVWVGGNIEIPEADTWEGEIQFTYISLRFKEKGGIEAFKAFNNIYNKYPTSTLVILGEKPPQEILSHPGVHYKGYLSKTNPDELHTFKKILANSFCLIHPTQMDALPQVIIECGYYGCPTISLNSFGIPEAIKHKETGLIINLPFNYQDFADAMLSLIENPLAYRLMRKKVRENSIENFSYNRIAKRIIEIISHSKP